MPAKSPEQFMRSWIKSQHLICKGTEFIFETVDQNLIERFEDCLNSLGGEIHSVKQVGLWPMGHNRNFKILRAVARVPRPACNEIVNFWALNGSFTTRYSEINEQ